MLRTTAWTAVVVASIVFCSVIVYSVKSQYGHSTMAVARKHTLNLNLSLLSIILGIPYIVDSRGLIILIIRLAGT